MDRVQQFKAFTCNKKSKDLKYIKRKRGSNYKELDNALMIWIRTKRQQKSPINGQVIKAKAMEFSKALNMQNFKVNNGFVSRFVKRHGLKFESKCGESESVNENIVSQWKASLKDKYNGFEPKDVYNMDETGLFGD